MSVFAKISNKVLLGINILVVLFFLLACLAAYISPMDWPVLYLFSLGFPFLLLLVLAFLGWWLFVKKQWALISAAALILGGGAITNFFAFNLKKPFQQEKKADHIRIVTWNVARFVEMVINNNKGSQTRYKMLQQIKSTNADILCFQEFSSSINPDWYNNIVAVSKGLGYPYFYYSHDWDGDRLFNGNVIFSRFPIIDTGIIRYPRPTLPEALLFVDIKKGTQLFRVYTTHLQSNQFRKEDISKIEALKKARGNIISNAFYIFTKLRTAIQHRSIQADMMPEILKNSPNPTIFCGDLNDVPNSYTYHTVKGNMHDAFLKKGLGIGRTYNSLSPTLRIDYIFTDDRFRIDQIKRVTTNYSDHYMMVCDMQLTPASD
ncbi:MAG: endonuclease/exonuclease/phosphatase family protein [Niabella sp.]|nr:endonuclease/exonuclease/phosphatase family protein [Niabella sp.]